MVCISELRGLQAFQTKHPETVVVAINVADDTKSQEAIAPLLKKQKLDNLRVATGKEWPGKFGMSEQIPITVVVADGKVRVVHGQVMADPVSYLEADLAAMSGSKDGVRGQ